MQESKCKRRKDFFRLKPPYSGKVKEGSLRDMMSGMSYEEIAKKYSIRDKSILSHWKRTFVNNHPNSKTISKIMIHRKSKNVELTGQESELQKKIEDLERSIKERDKLLRAKTIECNDERITKEMYKKMIDLAEEHFNIKIIKKHGAK